MRFDLYVNRLSKLIEDYHQCAEIELIERGLDYNITVEGENDVDN